MFTLLQNGETLGDCTAAYYVILQSENNTVREFIDCVLRTRYYDYGDIRINNDLYEYEKGKLLSDVPEHILNKTIKSASAHGGWGYMTYRIKV